MADGDWNSETRAEIDLESIVDFTPLLTSTLESGSLSQLLQSVPQALEESVVIIKEIITIDDCSVTLDVSGQTLGDTIELSGSSNSGENMSKEASNSSNSNKEIEESTSSKEASNSSNSREAIEETIVENTIVEITK